MQTLQPHAHKEVRSDEGNHWAHVEKRVVLCLLCTMSDKPHCQLSLLYAPAVSIQCLPRPVLHPPQADHARLLRIELVLKGRVKMM